MTAPHTYITTTIPYVNARPHIGFALELVQADVLARYRRGRGDAVRFQAGTDDNSLKNVLAAEAAGVEVQEFVDHNAEAFVALGDALSLTVDDVIRTSRDPRHRPGVERLWLRQSGQPGGIHDRPLPRRPCSCGIGGTRRGRARDGVAGCSRRSCLTRQRVSPFSARPAVTGDCRVLPRCSGGCR